MTKKQKMQPILNLMYSVIGLVFFNGIIQFVLYPYLNRQLGEESFGIVLTLLSLIAIVSGSFGTATNNARMVNVLEKETKNGDYNTILLILNAVGFAVVTIFLVVAKVFDWTNVIFINLLMFITTFRYYADVEYRKKLKYFSFMIYYVLIGIGYVIGRFLYMVLPIWQVSMLIGEALALLFVLVKGDIFKKFFQCSAHRNRVWRITCSLFIGELIANLILHSDRLLLFYLMDGNAVTVFYAASLVGKLAALVTVPLTGVIMGYLARFQGEFPKKYILIYLTGIFVMGALGFVVFYLISPFFIEKLYPNVYDEAMKILLFAILSQIVFFCSNLLNILILKFYKSIVQLIFSLVYLAIFIVSCILGIHYAGLLGFSIGAFIGTSVRILLLTVFLFLPVSRLKVPQNPDLAQIEN